MSVANFFKKKDRLDYSRQVTCPVAKKRYVPEMAVKNVEGLGPCTICPACGAAIPERINQKAFVVTTTDGHRMAYWHEGGFKE